MANLDLRNPNWSFLNRDSTVLAIGHSCDLMDPTKFCPFFTTWCDLMDPKSSCDLMDPNQDFPLSKFHVLWCTHWVHQNTWVPAIGLLNLKIGTIRSYTLLLQLNIIIGIFFIHCVNRREDGALKIQNSTSYILQIYYHWRMLYTHQVQCLIGLSFGVPIHTFDEIFDKFFDNLTNFLTIRRNFWMNFFRFFFFLAILDQSLIFNFYCLPPIKSNPIWFSDPEIQAENLAEMKHHKLARARRTGQSDKDLKPNAETRNRLNDIISYPNTQSLSGEDLIRPTAYFLTPGCLNEGPSSSSASSTSIGCHLWSYLWRKKPYISYL